MPQSSAHALPSFDSTDGLLADWNPGDSSGPSASGTFDSRREPKGAANLAETTVYPPRSWHDPTTCESLQFLQEFSLGDPDGVDAPGAALRRVSPDGETHRRRDRPPASERTKPRGIGLAGRPTGPGSGQSPSTRELPGAGDVLAGFRILQELGRGAFARVYLAEEIHLGGRLVAIKVSRAEGDEPRILARLQHTNTVPVHSVCDDRATGLRVLCMPYFGGANLAQVLDTAGGLTTTGRGGHSLVEALEQISQYQPAAASEFLRPASTRPQSSPSVRGPAAPGSVPKEALSHPAGLSALSGSALAFGFRSLLSRIIRGGAIPSRRAPALVPGDDPHQPSRQFLREATAVQAAVWIVARLAEGLDHAHSRGLLHRDLKPANILLAADGTPMLLDFNLAAETQPSLAEGEIGRAMLGGTLPYMAPEHLDAFDPHGTTPVDAVDERADMYALGLILFELLAGEHPFPMSASPTGSALSGMIGPMIEARRRPPSLRARCPQVPWSLDAVVAKCLEFDPCRRYLRARDLAEDLRRFLDDLPMKHAPEPSLRERAGKFVRRHRTLCSSTSILLFSLVLIVALGMGVAAVYSGMQGLAARFQRQAFERGFTEAQFLLNTAGASDRHLTAGLIEANRLFGRLELSEGRRDPAAEWFGFLTEAERRRLRQQVVELILLEAGARARLASRPGADSTRLAALRRAVAQLNTAASLADHVPAALFSERASYHAALGEAALADRDRQLAAHTRPATSHDWTLLGKTLLGAGDPAAGEDALRQALRLECTSFWAWFMMGHCHYAQARFLEAAGDFSACTALGSQFAWAHFNRGLALARAGLLNPARDAYDEALRLDPDFAEALVNRALVALELNQVESALADLTLAISLGRHDDAILAARGEALARLGRTDEARRQFDSLLSADPDDAVVRVARGMTQLRSHPRAAREDFERVLAREPRRAAAHYGMALLVRANDLKDALKHLDIALNADPHLIDAIQLRALVRARLGDPSALDDVDRLLKIPTAQRYYNAACAVALYADKARESRQRAHAVELLTRAVDLGFSTADAADDPDLASLRALPSFRRLLERNGK
jgi:serine/threonine protein kinase/tetratricopeptide (TPR) repeat protein